MLVNISIFKVIFWGLLLTSYTSVALAKAPPILLLAKNYDEVLPDKIYDYYISEKLDGVRAYWDGKQLLSKQGNPFSAPQWFTDALPKNIKLDGELWLGRQQFEQTLSIVRSEQSDWEGINYMLFDLPESKDTFAQRYQQLIGITKAINQAHLQVIPQFKITNKQALQQKLDEIIKLDGEGLMLHKLDALYQSGRSENLLKLKPFYDAEAVVVGHTSGKGKFSGMLGALIVRLVTSDIEFKIGSGFSLAQRQNPPKIGQVVTFKYYGFTRAGVPKFASFLRIRE